MNGDGTTCGASPRGRDPMAARSSRPTGVTSCSAGARCAPGPELDDYKALLGDGLWRPTSLEIFVMDEDGSHLRQVTSLGNASFAPFFTPDGTRIVFASNYEDPKGRDFDIYAIDLDGDRLERITYQP